MTGYSDISLREQTIEKKHKKSLKRIIALCFLACALMLLIQLGMSYIYYDLLAIAEGFVSDSDTADTVCSIFTYIVMMGVPGLLLMIGLKAVRNRKKPKIRFKRFAPKKALLFIVGTIGSSYLLNFIVYYLTGGLFSEFGSDEISLPTSALGIALTFVSMAVLPALLEEWIYRGIILKALLPYGRIGAILVSSIMFGMMHISPDSVIFATYVGIALAICYVVTGSVWCGVLIHFINNAYSTVNSYIFKYGSENLYAIDSLLTMLLMVIGFVAVIYYAVKGFSDKKPRLSTDTRLGYTANGRTFCSAFVFNGGFLPFMALFAFTLWLVSLV